MFCRLIQPLPTFPVFNNTAPDIFQSVPHVFFQFIFTTTCSVNKQPIQTLTRQTPADHKRQLTREVGSWAAQPSISALRSFISVYLKLPACRYVHPELRTRPEFRVGRDFTAVIKFHTSELQLHKQTNDIILAGEAIPVGGLFVDTDAVSGPCVHLQRCFYRRRCRGTVFFLSGSYFLKWT